MMSVLPSHHHVFHCLHKHTGFTPRLLFTVSNSNSTRCVCMQSPFVLCSAVDINKDKRHVLPSFLVIQNEINNTQDMNIAILHLWHHLGSESTLSSSCLLYTEIVWLLFCRAVQFQISLLNLTGQNTRIRVKAWWASVTFFFFHYVKSPDVAPYTN